MRHETGTGDKSLCYSAGIAVFGRQLALRMAAAANGIIAPLAGKRGLAASGIMIQRKTFKRVLLWRCNRDVIIGPAAGAANTSSNIALS